MVSFVTLHVTIVSYVCWTSPHQELSVYTASAYGLLSLLYIASAIKRDVPEQQAWIVSKRQGREFMF